MAVKYKAYPEYRYSGVEWLGQIPKNWKVFRGKFVFSEFGERSKTGNETLLSVSEYYGVKPRGDVIDNGDFLSRAESLVGYKKCKENDLVMNIMLAWKRGLGVTKYDGIVSPAYSVFRFHENASPDYMHYLLRTDLYIGYFKTRSTGVIDSRLRLYPESFGNVQILVPPISEQTKIANFLDRETARIDTLIKKQQQLIKLLKEKRQAVISRAVTKGLNPDAPMRDSGVKWLGDVPEHWVVCRLKHMKSTESNAFVDGPFGSNLKSEHFVDDGDVYVVESNFATTGKINTSKLKKISKQHFESIKRSSTKGGDIILAKIGARYGSSSILPDLDKKAVVSGNSLKLTVNKNLIRNDYANEVLRYLKANDSMDDGVNITAQPALSLGGLHNLPFLKVPLDEQDEIISYAKNIKGKFDTLILDAEKFISIAKERRTALISAAVTGKIDVRDWRPPEQNPISKEYVA